MQHMQHKNDQLLDDEGFYDELIAATHGDVRRVEQAYGLFLDLAAGKTSNMPDARRVLRILISLHVDDDTLIACLLGDKRLHDSLTIDVVEQYFGGTIARLVKDVRWLNTFKECEKEEMQAPEQAERLRRMLLAVTEDVRAVLIKLAYRIQRLRQLKSEPEATQRCIARETMEIYSPLANRLGVSQIKWEMEDLAFRYNDPERYKSVAKSLEETRSERESYVEEFVEEVTELLAQEGIQAEVYGRPKHIYSIWKKIQRKGIEVRDLYDLRAVRIVVDRVVTCYTALGIVHAKWHHIPSEFDDYIANPKDNGYQSLHTAVIGPRSRVVEVQVRTRQMHDFAELGVAAHWRYKEGVVSDAAMERAINSLRQLLEEDSDNDQALLDGFRSELFPDRVYALTPKGKVLDLPKGATPLDFAYHVHTEVGHGCRGAKVNGRIVSLNTPLNSGDQVEILTAKDGVPSRDWMNAQNGFLFTRSARAKVRQWFKHQDYEQNFEDGKHLYERTLRVLGLHGVKTDELLSRLSVQTLDELFLALGRGDVSTAQLAGAIRQPEKTRPFLQRFKSSRPAAKEKPRKPGEVHVLGVGNVLTQMAQCCKPLPGDPIIGYITSGKGITIHRQDCQNVLKMDKEQRNRLLEVSWGDEVEARPVDILLEAFDRQGLLRDVTLVLANERANVLSANTQTHPKDQSVSMRLTVEIKDLAQLSTLIDKIQSIPNVFEVRRAQ